MRCIIVLCCMMLHVRAQDDCAARPSATSSVACLIEWFDNAEQSVVSAPQSASYKQSLGMAKTTFGLICGVNSTAATKSVIDAACVAENALAAGADPYGGSGCPGCQFLSPMSWEVRDARFTHSRRLLGGCGE